MWVVKLVWMVWVVPIALYYFKRVLPVSTDAAHVLGPGEGVGGRVGAARAGGRRPGQGWTGGEEMVCGKGREQTNAM